MTKAKMKKNFLWNIVGSTLFAFNSLFFLIIVNRINGINDAGLFSYAFSNACLFYIFGIYCGRAFQVTETSEKISDSDYFYNKLITCLIMLLLSFIFCFAKEYKFYKSLIIILLIVYKMLEAFSESTYAIIQKDGNLYKVGFSLFIKSISGLVCFIIVDYFTHSIVLSIISLILTNFLFIVFYDFKNLSKMNFELEKLRKDNVNMIFKIGFYTFLFNLLTQYILNAPRYVIDANLSYKFQTIFGIIIMPATAINLMAQFLIHPFLLQLKQSFLNDIKKFRSLTFKLCLCIFGLGSITILCAYFIGIPVLEILYGMQLDNYLISLLLVLCGGICYGVSLILSTSLITMRSTLSQSIIYIIASAFIYFISNILVRKIGINGAIYAYLITMILIMIMYIIIFKITLKRSGDFNENRKKKCDN